MPNAQDGSIPDGVEVGQEPSDIALIFALKQIEDFELMGRTRRFHPMLREQIEQFQIRERKTANSENQPLPHDGYGRLGVAQPETVILQQSRKFLLRTLLNLSRLKARLRFQQVRESLQLFVKTN
jgi:hypothetical protein